MSNNFLLSIFAVKISNAFSRHIPKIEMQYSKLLKSVCDTMLENKYISDYKIDNSTKKSKIIISIDHKDKNVQKLSSFKLISKPSKRYYVNKNQIQTLVSSDEFTLYIVSTSSGIFSLQKALKNNVGGELLCSIF